MEEQTIFDVLLRIAAALERQVQQHDEAIERNLKLRDESIRKHDQQREEELAAALAVNQKLIAQIQYVIDMRAAESARRLDAVDPVGAAPCVSPSTREKESS